MEDQRYSMEDFEIIRVVGKGYMGKVMVVNEKSTNQIFAIKSIHKQAIMERKEVNHTRAERDILAELVSHQKSQCTVPCPFLVRLHAAFQDRANVYYLMDFHGGGDMAGLLAQLIRLPESWTRSYAAEIALGLGELHSRGIVYRDLKPENVLISSEGHVVLTDFGLSKSLADGCSTRTFCGTPEYLAPEVLLRRPYSAMVDWWSFGVLIYEMIVGMTPFWADVPGQMYSMIVTERPIDFPLSVVSPIARDLLTGLLSRNPEKRYGLKEVMEHSFFNGIDWDKASWLDVNSFDPIFTSMPPIITPEDSSFFAENSMVQKAFQGFSFRK